MIYLDYAATTPVDPRILDKYISDCKRYFANANSLHFSGLEAAGMVDLASETILRLLSLHDRETVFTSGASEANNLAIKGIANKKGSAGKHMITSDLEHASVTACFGFLQEEGYDIDIIESDGSGRVSLSRLEAMIHPDTVLVSIGAVNSETGIMQDIPTIAACLKKYPGLVFHTDFTQAVGKMDVDLSDIDLITISGHKIYGMKGVGALIKRRDMALAPMLHGGRSTTPYRSGTPAVALCLALAGSLELAMAEFANRNDSVKRLNAYLREKLKDIDQVVINSNEHSLPHFLNISVVGFDQIQVQKMLDNKGIMVSTQTACASNQPYSRIIHRLTGSMERARSSIRISISHLTTEAELSRLVDALKEATNQ